MYFKFYNTIIIITIYYNIKYKNKITSFNQQNVKYLLFIIFLLSLIWIKSSIENLVKIIDERLVECDLYLGKQQ